MPIAADEDIVRAICTDKLEDGIPSPSLFKGRGTSVSRLAVIPLEEHWAMFEGKVARPPERLLALIGEINVGDLQALGRTHPQPVELTVEPKPEPWNPAHAEIPQNITRGLANRIIRALKLHQPPTGE